MVILVTGATGTVGSALTAQLVAQGMEVRAATRNPAHYRGAGVPVAFDYADESTWSVLEGVDALFINNAGSTPEQGEAFIARATQAGVQRAVLMTARGIEFLPLEAPPRRLEKALMESGMEWTIVRPTWFMQNFSTGWLGKMVRDGVMRLPAGNGATSFIDARDIAAVGVAALTEPGHTGKAYGLTGGAALDHDQVAALISAATGKSLRYEAVSPEAFVALLQGYGWDAASAGFMNSIYTGVREGQQASTTLDVQTVTGKAPITFAQFVQDARDAW
jgi:uncharacterized protein YbjT (DUF2867 family)